MDSQGLKKELGLLELFCIAAGAMISSGLFILPGIAYARTGSSVILSYLLAGILFIPAILSNAELITAMTKSGGDYFFIERSMGAGFGTLGGFASWFSLSFKSAFALVGIGAILTLIYPDISYAQIRMIAVGACLFFIVINLLGVKSAGKAQVLLVLFLIALLVFYVSFGFPSIQEERIIPFMPRGGRAVFATAGLVFISYAGITKIAAVAEEVKNPGKNIPLAMFLAFSLVMILYLSVIFITIGLVDSAKLSRSLAPISLGAGSFMGRPGTILMAIAALLAFFSTANAGILSASRYPMAMSRDQLLPKVFQKISPKFGTPFISILSTGIFMLIVILFLNLENLVKTASTLYILLFILVNFSLIIMRESKIQNYRPKFHSPLYPWIQIAGIIGCGFLIYEMGAIPLLVTAAFIAAGFLWYLLYARGITRKSAIIHIVERLSDRELRSGSLGKELKGILKERDNIVEDRFDQTVKRSEILDLKSSLFLEEFLEIAAERLSPRLNLKTEELFKLFVERERESATVLRPELAAPHIIVPGNNKFEILLARCKNGIFFSDEFSRVYVVFVLASSRDERNFYLRGLMSIAHITQEKDFDQRWLNAKGPEELRDLILLSGRKRHI